MNVVESTLNDYNAKADAELEAALGRLSPEQMGAIARQAKALSQKNAEASIANTLSPQDRIDEIRKNNPYELGSKTNTPEGRQAWGNGAQRFQAESGRYVEELNKSVFDITVVGIWRPTPGFPKGDYRADVAHTDTQKFDKFLEGALARVVV